MSNWLQRLLRPDSRSRTATAPLHFPPTPMPVYPALTPSTVYQQSPWVYIAINRIAEAAALVPLRVLQASGEALTEVERHPLETLLDAPNPHTSRFELIENTIGMLELYGNAYWAVIGDARGIPAEIWPLRPDRVSIVPETSAGVRGYLYEVDGLRVPLEPTEVVHFRRWHPANDYYGLSALEAGRLAITTDRAMSEWNRSIFGQDNGVPSGIVSIREFVSDSDFARIQKDWNLTYGGPQRRTAFLRGGDIQWTSMGMGHSDLDFLKGRTANRDEILNLFGVPVALLSENATEANAKVAERLFIERTLWPKLVRIAQKITQELLPFYPGQHVALFEDIRPTDTQARLEEIRVAYPLLSINELRTRYFSLPPVAWGEVSAAASPAPAMPSEPVAAPLPAEAVKAQQDQPAGLLDASEELAQWERFALRRVGRSGGRAFEVRALPDELAFEIAAELAATQDTEAVKAVFHDARERLQTSAPP